MFSKLDTIAYISIWHRVQLDFDTFYVPLKEKIDLTEKSKVSSLYLINLLFNTFGFDIFFG